jgi:hypothetical protein
VFACSLPEKEPISINDVKYEAGNMLVEWNGKKTRSFLKLQEKQHL